MTVPRTVHTNQLLVMREPFVTLESPLVCDKRTIARIGRSSAAQA